jgi:hypothetical protein
MVRVTDAEHRAFGRRASMSGLSTSAWIRMVALRQIARDELEEKDK